MPTSPPTGPVTDQLTTRLQRTEIQRAASSIPGRVIVQVVTEIPEGVESGLAHAPRRGGWLHPRGHRQDGDRGSADAHPARR
jgi:hypothetical protein